MSSSFSPFLITHVMDMDGFFVGRPRKFLVKELAILDLDRNKITHLRFKLGMSFDDLSPGDKRTAVYVARQVNGIPFDDTLDDVHDQEDLEVATLACLSEFRARTDCLVAYKGGQIERDLLSILGVRAFNIESLGCPKFDLLCQQPYYGSLLRSMQSAYRCTAHRFWRHNRPFHCVVVEVLVFARWLALRLTAVETEFVTPLLSRSVPAARPKNLSEK